MPRLFRKISDRVRSFGHSSKDDSLNHASSEKENCLFMEKRPKRKRSSLVKTVAKSLRKRRKCGDAKTESILGRGRFDIRFSNDGYCSSEGESCINRDSTFTSPPSVGNNTPLRDLSSQRNRDEQSINTTNSRNNQIFSESPSRSFSSNLKRIQRCDNLTALSENQQWCTSPVLQSMYGPRNVRETNSKSRNLDKLNMNILKHENKETMAERFHELTEGKRIIHNPKGRLSRSTETNDRKECTSQYILPAVRQFKPVKSAKGRIVTEDRYSVWSKSKCENPKSRSVNSFEQSFHCNYIPSKQNSPIMSPVSKVRKVDLHHGSSIRIKATESQQGKPLKNPTDIKNTSLAPDAVTNFVDLLYTEQQDIENEGNAGWYFKPKQSEHTLPRHETLESNVLPKKLSTPKQDLFHTTPRNGNQGRVEMPKKLTSGPTNLNISHETSEITSGVPVKVNICDESPNTPPYVYGKKEPDLSDKNTEAKQYREKFPFLSPKQVQYIFAKDKDGLPLCRSQSACNMMESTGTCKEIHPMQRRNSLSGIDKFSRYIDFLESRQSPNKTSGDFYVSEVMNGLISECGQRVESLRNTPNTKNLDKCEESTQIFGAGDSSKIYAEIETSGIAGKKTCELYPKVLGKTAYFAPVY